MSHRPSGLWCDLCGMPILSDPYWHIGITDKTTGIEKPGHACGDCKEKWYAFAEMENEKDD